MRSPSAATVPGSSLGEPTAKSRVHLGKIKGDYERCLREGLDYIGILQQIGRGDRVAVKPNLTFPTFRPGVMTNPEAVEAILRILIERGARVSICESDSGGYSPFSMTEVFETTGLLRIAHSLGVEIVNLSGQPSRIIKVKSGLRVLSVPLPLKILDETDWFISMPVPKVHLNTVLSLSMKNQWGIIPEPAERLKLHPYFTDVIHTITKLLPRAVAVMDGRYGLNRSGPMKGDAIELGWSLVASDLYACDLVAAALLGIDYRSVPHLRVILKREHCLDINQIACNVSPVSLVREPPFYLKRLWTDYPGLLTFRSRVLAYLGYESPLAEPLHRLLYRFREPFY